MLTLGTKILLLSLNYYHLKSNLIQMIIFQTNVFSYPDKLN